MQSSFLSKVLSFSLLKEMRVEQLSSENKQTLVRTLQYFKKVSIFFGHENMNTKQDVVVLANIRYIKYREPVTIGKYIFRSIVEIDNRLHA